MGAITVQHEQKEDLYKQRIRAQLSMTLPSGFIPEIGEHRKGKVRDVHFLGDTLVMVASDRVSTFDHVLSRCIPFKGAVLNAFNRWAMENTADIIPNAAVSSPDDAVVVQRRYTNAGFELIVRGYVWGSLASDYEKGERKKSGVTLPDGLLRYQKLEHPIFTPTTKAEHGHDLDITINEIAAVHGKVLAEKMRSASLQLYERGAALAQKAGMILVDTKFEFGLDEKGNVFLIDESLTPDSSRYVDLAEYQQKWPKIQAAMKSGKYKDVTEASKADPSLKIREASKQFVRDVLIESGYQEGKPLPELSDEQVVETSWRYIESYEKLTGKQFTFTHSELPSARKRIMNNLVQAKLAHGACVVPIGASEKDRAHWEKIEAGLKEAGVPYVQPFWASAHKETQKVLDYVRHMDADSIEPLIYLPFAGRSNGLGPVVAGNTKYPVITCPPFSDTAAYMVDIHSSMRMPSNLPMIVIVEPGNAALMAKRIMDMLRV